MSGIFVSYRRDDTSYIAGRLHDGLSARFGADQIFRDIDTIRPGADFVARIEEAVGSCDALIAVIGDDWLAVDATGRRRIDNPGDFVRLEIGAALERGILVVPVLVENAHMPAEADLPEPIRLLSRRNAVDLTDARWDYDMQRITAAVEEVVRPPDAGPAAPPPPAPPPPAADMPRAAAIPGWIKAVVPAVLIVVAVSVGAFVASTGSEPEPEPETPTTEVSVVVASTTATTAARGTTTTTAGGPRVVTGPFTGRSGGLTLTVERIEVSASALRVHLLANNATGDSLTLPASGFSAVDNTGRSYRPDPFSKDWPRDIPPGSVRGVVDLAGPLQPGASTMRVGWGTIFGTLKVRSIFVDNVRLT